MLRVVRLRDRLIDRWRSLSPTGIDLVLAVVLFVISVESLAVAKPMGTTGEADLLGFVLIAFMTLPLVVRRRYPLIVFGVAVAAMFVYQFPQYPPSNADSLGPVFALYAVVMYRQRWMSLAACLLVLGALIVPVPFTHRDVSAGEAVGVVVILAMVWLVSDMIRSRRVQTEELARANAELAEARDELAHQAVAEERVRIARELHDVVAHSMSVIAVQSGMGRHVIATQPEEAAKALQAIEETSRASLNEMRRILSVLRSEDDPQGSLAPSPTLLDVDKLAEHVRGTGLPVTLDITGQRGKVPAGVDLSAYRIVQEALTNVIKHAGRAAAEVHIEYAEGSVMVEVTDDGRGAAATVGTQRLPGSGNGLVGMRERAAVYHGDVVAGPVTGGGFRVRARLPYDMSGA